MIRRGLGTIGIIGVSAVLTYGAAMLLTRVMSKSEFGAYSFYIAVAMALGTPAQAGITTFITRETSRSRARDNWGLGRGVIRRALQLSLAIALLVACACVAEFFFGFVGARYDPMMLILPLFIVMTSGVAVRSAALRGVDKVILAQIPEGVIRPTALLLALAGAWLVVGDLGRDLAIMLTLAAYVLSMAACLALYLKHVAVRYRGVQPIYRDRQWIREVAPFSLGGGAFVLMALAGPILLGLLANANEVAEMRIATQLAQVGGLGYTAAVMNVSPRLAAAHVKGDIPSMEEGVRQATLLALLASAPLLLIFLAAGAPLLGLLFGVAYEKAAPALVIIATAHVVNAAFGCSAAALNMSGHQTDCLVIYGAGLIILCVLTGLLAEPFGATGAAAAFALTTLATNLALWTQARRRLGLDTGAWILLKRRKKDI
jgi:O-antigen/teichoic acid export membrane protein